MVRQYPYQLWALLTSEATRDGQGNYLPPTKRWMLVNMCRDEVNNAGKIVTLEDSTESVFDYLIQLPAATCWVAAGTPVEVRDGTRVRASGTAKRFSRGQLHARLWV